MPAGLVNEKLLIVRREINSRVINIFYIRKEFIILGMGKFAHLVMGPAGSGKVGCLFFGIVLLISGVCAVYVL